MIKQDLLDAINAITLLIIAVCVFPFTVDIMLTVSGPIVQGSARVCHWKQHVVCWLSGLMS